MEATLKEISDHCSREKNGELAEEEKVVEAGREYLLSETLSSCEKYLAGDPTIRNSIISKLNIMKGPNQKLVADWLRKLDHRQTEAAPAKSQAKKKTPGNKPETIPIKDLTYDEEFRNFFHFDQHVFDNLVNGIRDNGEDELPPVCVWRNNGKLVLFDGHTRVKALKECSIGNVKVKYYDFPNRENCLLQLIKIQSASRRNMNNADRLAIIRACGDLEAERAVSNQGTRTDLKTSGQDCLEVAGNRRLAELVGMSERTVKKLKKILLYPKYEKMVSEESLTISSAYDSIRKEEKSDTQPTQEASTPNEEHAPEVTSVEIQEDATVDNSATEDDVPQNEEPAQATRALTADGSRQSAVPNDRHAGATEGRRQLSEEPSKPGSPVSPKSLVDSFVSGAADGKGIENAIAFGREYLSEVKKAAEHLIGSGKEAKVTPWTDEVEDMFEEFDGLLA